ncbi:MAG TPA: GAF domain-containing protein [Anaerolineales bacterium]|nr:GAF domain-containing protein [Anaerolineales bacterium]
MKHPSESHFNIYASLLLGGIGLSLILIPEQTRIVSLPQPAWVFFVPGTACFILALCLQVITLLPLPQRKARIYQFLSAALLIVLSSAYYQNGFVIEGGVFFVCGVMQLFFFLPIARRFNHLDLVSVAVALSGFIAGIQLALSNEQHGNTNLTQLAIGFFITSFLGASGTILPGFKVSKYVQWLQALPWLAWAILCIPSGQGANFVAATVLILLALFKDLLPIQRLTLPKGDILGQRVIMIGATIELVLLIFIGALLIGVDQSVNGASQISARQGAFFFFIIVAIVINYEVITILMTIHGLMVQLNNPEEDERITVSADDRITSAWNSRLTKYIKPYVSTREGVRIRMNAQLDQITALSRQLVMEKKRNAQLTLLLELSQQLENQLDQPVAAQLVVNTLERALNCSLATIYIHEPQQKEFMLLAAAGQQTSLIPSGYRQSASIGAIGRACRQRKTQIINDIRMDADYIPFRNEENLSAVLIPLIFNGHMNGIITIHSEVLNGFGSIDIGLAEAVAAELTRAWERSGYHQRLMDLIQAGSQLSSVVDPMATAQDVAAIAREILQARFTYVHIQLGQERSFIQSASSGFAPRLLESLETSIETQNIIQIAFQASQPFRVRDIRKYSSTAHLAIDNTGLRSMLTIPIRWHQVNIGGIFAFGKQNEVFFSENDESLAELLAIQAAGAFESTWLQQELRSSLRITSLLYRLSNQIIMAENLENAAADIAQTAHKLAKSTVTGIVLFNPDESIAAQIKLDSDNQKSKVEHPTDLIRNAMDSGQLIHFSNGASSIRTCLPIQTPIRKYGAIWMDTPDEPGHNPSTNPNDLQALVNQAAIALERSMLLVESRRQAEEIKQAYDTLEATYDQTLASLASALDARDRETEGHSKRVSNLVVRLGKFIGISGEQLKVLERGSILHDIGKIGISDTILHKPGPLTDKEWETMKLHPDIGAKIVEGIPFLEDTIPIIRHHQERYNGTGYPGGLKGEEIPLLARLFSVVDTFDALTSDRPYRKKIAIKDALQYLRDESKTWFDPEIVKSFERLILTHGNDLLPPD